MLFERSDSHKMNTTKMLLIPSGEKVFHIVLYIIHIVIVVHSRQSNGAKIAQSYVIHHRITEQMYAYTYYMYVTAW